MIRAIDQSSLVALLRTGARPSPGTLADPASPGWAETLLDAQLGLLARDARERAAAELAGWRARGIEVVGAGEDDYPPLLRDWWSAPALLFVHGHLVREDHMGVAVVGTRVPSERGARAARAIARRLVQEGFVVVSGLAAGIDTEAHTATLAARGRTIAVAGCGLGHCYPRQNATLQQQLARDSAVVSQFWPEVPPSRRTFPLRNGTMAAMTQATVIVEAGPTSGTRIQARLALECGRPVLLLPGVVTLPWGRELAQQPGVTVVHTPSEVAEALSELAAPARPSEAGPWAVSRG